MLARGFEIWKSANRGETLQTANELEGDLTEVNLELKEMNGQSADALQEQKERVEGTRKVLLNQSRKVICNRMIHLLNRDMKRAF